MKTATVKSDGLLLVTAAIWGFAFVAQRVGMDHVGPFTYNGVRFALGALTLAPLLLMRARSPGAVPVPMSRRGFICGGGALGVVLFAAASLQQVALLYTTAGKAGFITGLYVVVVPVLGLFLGAASVDRHVDRCRAGGCRALPAVGHRILPDGVR